MDKFRWVRHRAIERKVERVTRIMQIEEDLQELEEYKNNLLWEIRAERLLTPEAYKMFCKCWMRWTASDGNATISLMQNVLRIGRCELRKRYLQRLRGIADALHGLVISNRIAPASTHRTWKI